MTETQSRAELVETVARACRILGKLNLTRGALGHVSYRLDGTDSMLIKGKGPKEVGLRYTSTNDVLEVDFNANKVSGADGLQPPSESYLHIWLYKKNPHVRSVIHVHPEHAVLLTICEKEILPIYGSYTPQGADLAVRGVPVFPRSVTISNDQLGEQFATFVGDKTVALMRGHGVSVVGSGIEDATVRTIDLDVLVTMTYKAYLLGTPKPIPPDDVEAFGRPRDTQRARGSAGGVEGLQAQWRYYCSLTDED